MKAGLILVSVSLVVVLFGLKLRSNETEKAAQPAPAAKTPRVPVKPEFVRGIHLTSWAAGSKKSREKINALLKDTELNTVVVAVKEYEGEIYIPGVPLAEKYKIHVNAIPDVKDYVERLKSEGIYTIARIVVFKDNSLPRKRPDLGVKKPDGTLWTDRHKITWLDPYNKEAWDYNISVASQAIMLGFDEIQFDYIRFPSDGDTKQCRYSFAHHSSSYNAKCLDDFLEYASGKIKPMGANLSIDIFGLTPSVSHDMGIGQKFNEMTQWVDFVSPMTYPSHYAKGEYGIPNPNAVPYRVVHKTMYDANKRLGDLSKRLRPYLQDFSLGYKYGPKEVRAQIEACEDQGIKEWLLWNPNCNYTRKALRSKKGVLDPEAETPKSWKQDSAKEKKKETSAGRQTINEKASGRTTVSGSSTTAPIPNTIEQSTPSKK